MESEKHFPGNLKSRISNLLLKESSSDVQFLVGIPPERYRCHKLILAAGSEVFEAMFYGTLRQKSPVRVPDVEPKGFALMLQYLYSDTVSIQDIFEAFDAAYASKKYIVNGLFSFCEDYLLDKVSITPESVFFILEGASFLEMKNLRRRCLQYVSRNARKVFLSGSYIMASRDVFQDVLKTDLMDVESETEIIEALWSWGQERCRDKGIECSAENVRDFTDGLLVHVRFSTLTTRELAIAFEKFQLLDTANEMALLWNLAMPQRRKPLEVLPIICAESRTRCLKDCPKIELPGQYQYSGNMTTFTIENHKMEVEMTVSGPPVTLIGVVIAFRPIPCYSHNDRSLKVKIVANNITTGTKFHAKSTFKAECDDEVHQILLLEEFLVVEEEHVASISLTVSGEGVKLMQLMTEEALRYDLGQTKVFLKFDESANRRKTLLPIKELMVV